MRPSQQDEDQVSNFNNSVTAGSNYEYYADGRIRYAGRLDNNIFDRKYTYDHAGRFQDALSGSEARGGTTADGPYSESFAYDVWGNTTSHSSRIWTANTTTDTASFTNNRRQGWGYDANGFITANSDSSLSYSHEYDAGGKRSRYVPNVDWVYGQPAVEMNDSFDGDGLPNKRVDTRRSVDPETYQPYTVSTTGYYLHATGLGGQVIAELDSQQDRKSCLRQRNGTGD